ncbi:hypothetical protein ACTFIV_009911 [Dictyostelium citrinum]
MDFNFKCLNISGRIVDLSMDIIISNCIIDQYNQDSILKELIEKQKSIDRFDYQFHGEFTNKMLFQNPNYQNLKIQLVHQRFALWFNKQVPRYENVAELLNGQKNKF